MTRHLNNVLDDDARNPQRIRLALVVLLVGVGLLLVALGLGMLRLGSPSEELVVESPRPPGTPLNDRQRAVAATAVFVYGTILLLVFVVAALALVAASRRYRRRLTRQTPPPTPVEDVWSQHRLPDAPAEGAEPSEESPSG